MMPRKKRKALIIVPVVILVLIISILFILLYLNTDVFKSNQTLFIKYIGQNAENMEEIYKVLAEDEYGARLKESKYTNETQVKINYTENVGTSSENTKNSINQLKLKIEGQTDLKNGYNYQNLNLLNNDNKVMQVEYIQDDITYGIRFTDLFKQYILVENSNLKELFKKMGYTDEEIANIPDNIEFRNENNIIKFSDEEKENLKNKYFNIIGSDFSKENFTKENNQIIKINDKDLNVNKYSLNMTEEQLNGIYIKILEELKQDEIILTKLDDLQELINKYKISNDSTDTSLRQRFVSEIDKTIEEINKNNIGQDKVSIVVYESNKITVRTSVISSKYVINFDWLPEENNKYARY